MIVPCHLEQLKAVRTPFDASYVKMVSKLGELMASSYAAKLRT